MTKHPGGLRLLHMVEKTHKHQDFADRLNAEMQRKGVSIRDLSEACGVTYEMARRYTLGTAKPRDEKMDNIATWLGVTAAWLDYGSDTKTETSASPKTERKLIPSPSEVAEEVLHPKDFQDLSEDEMRLLRLFRVLPYHAARNLLGAFEVRYKQLYDFYVTYSQSKEK
ncbi:helix-turn-helix domain-containing protein [Enterobacter asburiae]|uniref:helix-turn-helix domain-containing protein n=1 Tax=Enterobacter asburiae TaxID=61645 RepID=UPI00287B5289|nr:helix-turn-helix domain-containing protein [Enterobacter asburiae]MDS1913301.1 helix-turn-helix domain-containing protein [Enterobacter asburiae]